MRSADWTVQRFFHTGDGYFQQMIQMIREAGKSIRVETYIFEMDPMTEILLTELRAARHRGCQVEMLVDGFGSFYWLQTLMDRCQKDDIELRVWEPLPRGLSSLRRLILVLQFRMLLALRKLNRRDHRKVTIVDDRKALLGSMNWTQLHSESRMGDKAWRDSGVLLEGTSVKDLVDAFKKAWRLSKRSHWRPLRRRNPVDSEYNPRTSRVRLNTTRKDRRYLRQDFQQRIRQSRERLLFVSAYFLPTRGILTALLSAARRGVQIQIIVPGPSDVPLVKWAAAGLYKKLLRAGIQLHEYQASVLHAKYYMIDEIAILGSSNLNHRSMFHDLEVEAIFDHPESISNLQEQWSKDASNSRPLTLQELLSRSIFRRFLESLAFRLRYIL